MQFQQQSNKRSINEAYILNEVSTETKSEPTQNSSNKKKKLKTNVSNKISSLTNTEDTQSVIQKNIKSSNLNINKMMIQQFNAQNNEPEQSLISKNENIIGLVDFELNIQENGLNNNNNNNNNLKMKPQKSAPIRRNSKKNTDSKLSDEIYMDSSSKH